MNKEPLVLKRGKLAGAIYTVFVFLYVIIAVVGGTAIKSLEDNGVIYYAISALFSPIAFIITIIFFKFYKKEERVNFALNKTAPLNYGYAVLLFLAMLFGLSNINIQFIQFLDSVGIKTSQANIVIGGFSDYIILVITIAIIPAVVEELLFRGLILNHTIGSNKWATYLAVGFMFAIFHGSLSQLIYQFIYGVLLCALCDKAKSVIPVILTHFLNNFVILTAEYAGFNLGAFLANPLIIGLGLLLLVGFVFAMIYKGKKYQTPSDISGLFMPYGLFGVLLFVMLIIMG